VCCGRPGSFEAVEEQKRANANDPSRLATPLFVCVSQLATSVLQEWRTETNKQLVILELRKTLHLLLGVREHLRKSPNLET
jgi:hypothetical protein